MTENAGQENTVKELKEFFSTPDKPVTAPEFMSFWKSCDDEDKAYYKSADLTA